MKKDVIQILKSKIKDLTTSQSHVADYILKKPTESAFLTIDQLARAVGTSTTTIMRMVFSLDYSGYVEFQKDLQSILRNQIPQARLQSNLQELDRNEFLIKCAQTQIHNIENTLETLSDESLEEVIKSLLDANKIHCTAARMSYTVAYYLNQGLNRLTGKSKLLISGTGDLPESLLNISSSDVLIAISFPRYTSETVKVARVAKSLGAKVISITDGYTSEIAQYSDHILPCHYDSNAFHNSPIGAMFVADYLISAVAFRQIEVTNNRLKKVETILKEMNSHVLDFKP